MKNLGNNQQINQNWKYLFVACVRCNIYSPFILLFTIYWVLHTGGKKCQLWYRIRNRYWPCCSLSLYEDLHFVPESLRHHTPLNINTSPYGRPTWFTTAFQHQLVFLCSQLIIIVTGSDLNHASWQMKREKMFFAAFLKVVVKASLMPK